MHDALEVSCKNLNLFGNPSEHTNGFLSPYYGEYVQSYI